jgi:hypothetical protein
MSERSIATLVLRGTIWGIIGLIYAPLLVALREIFLEQGWGHWAYVPAAAIAGGVGAAFYGARQVAIMGALLGVAVGSVLLLFADGPISVWRVALPAVAVGLIAGSLVRFPDRCSLHVPGKTLSGLTTGAGCGLLLAAVEPLRPGGFPIAASVAFLVSVNGILYVASVRWWVDHVEQRLPCNAVEALVIALLAGLVAASLWIVSGPLVGIVDAAQDLIIRRMHESIAAAMLGAALAGAVTGALLEAFDVKWVHDL